LNPNRTAIRAVRLLMSVVYVIGSGATRGLGPRARSVTGRDLVRVFYLAALYRSIASLAASR
jgi:hypothetical protein